MLCHRTRTIANLHLYFILTSFGAIMDNNQFLNFSIPSLNLPIILVQFIGEEYLSQPYCFKLTVAASKNLLKQELTGKPALLRTGYLAQTPQYHHGLIYSVKSLHQFHQNLPLYEIILRPWFAFLHNIHDCRVYATKQPLTVPEITSSVFKEYQQNDFNLKFIQKKHPVLNFCVQHNESTYHFISRLLINEEISYYFKHDKNKHALIFDDCNHFSELEKIKISLKNKQAKNNILDWKQLTKLLSNTNNSGHQKNISAKSNALNLYAGTKINIESHGDFLIYGILHQAKNSIDGLHPASYKNHFLAHPSSRTFTPKRRCCSSFVLEDTIIPIKEIIKPALEQAMVVGVDKKEIFSAAPNHIKIKFHWDRDNDTNEHNSCWIPIKQPWAGQHYGVQFTPRIKQGVAVTFKHGDPNQPVTLGAFPYKPPFKTDNNPFINGLKTLSLTKKNPGNDNAIILNDRQKDAAITLQAKRNLELTIKQNYSQSTQKNTAIISKKGNYTVKVKQDCTITATQSILIHAGGSILSIKPSEITLQSQEIIFGG